jgi:hypothetical protein
MDGLGRKRKHEDYEESHLGICKHQHDNPAQYMRSFLLYCSVIVYDLADTLTI